MRSRVRKWKLWGADEDDSKNVGGRQGEQQRKEGEEGKKNKKTGILDRSNAAGSHSYFSFTLLCIRAWFQRYPSPEEAFQQTVFANFSSLSLPFGVSARAAQKGLLLPLLQLLLSLCRRKVNTWGRLVHLPLLQCITNRSHRKVTNIFTGRIVSSVLSCIQQNMGPSRFFRSWMPEYVLYLLERRRDVGRTGFSACEVCSACLLLYIYHS